MPGIPRRTRNRERVAVSVTNHGAAGGAADVRGPGELVRTGAPAGEPVHGVGRNERPDGAERELGADAAGAETERSLWPD